MISVAHRPRLALLRSNHRSASLPPDLCLTLPLVRACLASTVVIGQQHDSREQIQVDLADGVVVVDALCLSLSPNHASADAAFGYRSNHSSRCETANALMQEAHFLYAVDVT